MKYFREKKQRFPNEDTIEQLHSSTSIGQQIEQFWRNFQKKNQTFLSIENKFETSFFLKIKIFFIFNFLAEK